MRYVKAFHFGIDNGLFQVLVFELGNLSAHRTDNMVMRLVVVRTFILRSIAKLVLDDQPRIYQQDNRIVQGSTADPELFLVGHIDIQVVNVEMSLYRINRIQYTISGIRLLEKKKGWRK